jgi:cation:H+ antiporter
MLMILIKIIGGLILLLFGGNYLVKGAVELTKYFKISKLFVGLTVVAMGTSMPELLVSVQAAFKGLAIMSLGNVIGSNIANIAFILALTVIIFPIPVKKQTILIDWPIMAFSFLLLIVFLFDGYLSFFEGLIFVIMLVGYIYLEIVYSKKEMKIQDSLKTGDEILEKKVFSIPIALIVIALSSAALAFGADILVDGASALAIILGVSERVISISIVAVGTSLPELAASLVAAFKKETEVSVGNIIGSNIFNIFCILGITALIHPITFDVKPLIPDLIWMSSIGLLLFLFFIPFKKPFMNRYKGVILLLGYIIYMILLFAK